jgi:hypothetical protein
MNRLHWIVGSVLVVAAVSGVAYANLGGRPEPVEFYQGHTHGENGKAIGAPEHSGGLDRNGCHNGSVPYHCH